MPNKDGRFGGYSSGENGNGRRVRAPGVSGGVRRVSSSSGQNRPRSGFSLLRSVPTPRAPQPPASAAVAPTPADARQKARALRQRRRTQRRLTLMGAAGGILLLAGIITLLLPKGSPVAAATAETAVLPVSLVAPLPYGEANSAAEGGSTIAAPDWGQVGPVRQTDSFTFAAAPASIGVEVPEFGTVDTAYFADAAFLGDSLTAGFTEYGIDMGGALICGYEGTSPNQIVNRTTLSHPSRGEEIPLDVLSAAQPKKLYILLGTNALVGEGNDEGFLAYYAQMLDTLHAALPNTLIYVQSILPVRPDALESAPGLSSQRLSSINDALKGLCAEKGCRYLDLWQVFADDSASLSETYAQPDGIHITVGGYTKWISYLCSHVPYNKANPYQQGSTWYLSDALRQLLSDLP